MCYGKVADDCYMASCVHECTKLSKQIVNEADACVLVMLVL